MRWSSKGLEEKYQAVVKRGYPKCEPVGQRWGRSSLHYGGEGVLVHPSYQGVCGRHGTEDECRTHGDLVMSGTLALYKDGWINKVERSHRACHSQEHAVTSKGCYKETPKCHKCIARSRRAE